MEQKKEKTFVFNVNVECVQYFKIKAKNKTEALKIIKESIDKYGSVNGSNDAQETDYNISDGQANSLDDLNDFEEVKA
jgi:uncharacterized lipoprotein YehR (DUF1307 family)